MTSFKDGIPRNDYFIRFKKMFNLDQKKQQIMEEKIRKKLVHSSNDDCFYATFSGVA